MTTLKFVKISIAGTLLVILISCGIETPETPEEGDVAANSGTIIVIEPGALEKGQLAYGSNPFIITPNTSVTWINKDSFPHTVTSTDKAFDSGIISPGQRYTFTFQTSGTYPYYSSLPGETRMTGVIQVGMLPPPLTPAPPPVPAPIPPAPIPPPNPAPLPPSLPGTTPEKPLVPKPLVPKPLPKDGLPIPPLPAPTGPGPVPPPNPYWPWGPNPPAEPNPPPAAPITPTPAPVTPAPAPITPPPSGPNPPPAWPDPNGPWPNDLPSPRPDDDFFHPWPTPTNSPSPS